MKHPFQFGEDTLTPALALALARGSLNGAFSSTTKEKIIKSHDAVAAIANGDRVVYGVNTGFGPLCTTIISKEQTRALQENILRSHSVGVGDAVPQEVVKLMLVTKLHALSFGYSGIALATLERIHWHLQNDIIPMVPTQGSVGASGDLAPLAHLFLPLIGLGQVMADGQIQNSLEVLEKHHREPLKLGPKEGLALINGTQFILAYATRAVERLHNCLELADIIGAMSLEGVLGSAAPFHSKLHQLRPFAGNQHVAFRLRTLLKDSEMVASHQNCGRVQDPYSLRCMPQVHGSSRSAWLHLYQQVTTELNSVTDNPIILSAEESISGGNFHGQPLALPLDYATLAAAEVGNISDRRTYLLLEGGEAGLPKLLMKNTGINSGFMIPQYTSAALVSENKSLCFPASADSIPTSLGQEDHVSMGSISGRKLNQVIDNLENILAVEMICAAQAFDYRRPMKSGKILEACHELIRSQIDHAEEDRIFANDIRKAHNLISSGAINSTAYDIAQKHDINLKGDYYEQFSIS
ncbi:histidine ammonia-lyase [Marinoscillum furvescens]|uniref:Histidine ammonia-lyase n=1 Tax=Marinoscillum furvescens DSM 4134 TaxID=1122208 RepID=A0A3D9LHJ2_MARFU|nr:histidine ammonia-lyase [Marinoscillum furvescens]REE05974.1 histidine ammonia-lyase [Marinoscillum furvescens DSM 4134]